MPFSLDKSRRIRRSSDYKRVYDEGAKVSGKCLIAVIRPSEGPLRVGITVSRKVGSACVRNLVKRRIREAVRRELDPVMSGWDVVLIARGQTKEKRPKVAKESKGAVGVKGPGGQKAAGCVKCAGPASYPSFSGIIKDIKRIAGRLSGI